jgi:hypothetical protein
LILNLLSSGICPLYFCLGINIIMSNCYLQYYCIVDLSKFILREKTLKRWAKVKNKVLYLHSHEKLQWILDVQGRMLPRRPTEESHQCSECTELSMLRSHKFTYTVCTEALSIHNLKSHGVGYATVPKITVVYTDTAHHNLDLILGSLSWILESLIKFSHTATHLPLKTCHLSTNPKFLLCYLP